MKKRFLKRIIFAVGFFSFAINTQAAEIKTLILLNHFTKPIQFSIGTNPDVLPDFPQNFSLATNGSSSSKMQDTGKNAYIRGEVTAESKSNHVFFAVGLKNQEIDFHGYISKGIAYSMKNNTIVFCTPEDYKPNHHC